MYTEKNVRTLAALFLVLYRKNGFKNTSLGGLVPSESEYLSSNGYCHGPI